MLEAGIMGYSMEAPATREYWFNSGGDVFPPEWKHPVTGMVWSGGKVFGTYFTGDPAWVYGIQWIPASPMLSYLVKDTNQAKASWENMIHDYNQHEKEEAAKPENASKGYVAQKASIKTFGPALGSVMLGYKLMFDPGWAADQLDTLWRQPGDEIAHNADEMAIMYYMAHSMKRLGTIEWKQHTSSPTSMVFHNTITGQYHYVVWNPGSAAQKVTVYEQARPIGYLVAAPRALTDTSTLLR